MSREMFQAICRCACCAVPAEVWRCDDQSPEPWLGHPEQPVMGLGIDPGNIKEDGLNTTALRQSWVEGRREDMYERYQRECEADPLAGEMFFNHLWAMLPLYLRGQVVITNLVRCRRSPGRQNLLLKTMDQCYSHHLHPLLDAYRPRMVYHAQTRGYLLSSGYIAEQYAGDPSDLPELLQIRQDDKIPKVVYLRDGRAVVYMQHPTFRRYTDELARFHREAIDEVCRVLGIYKGPQQA